MYALITGATSGIGMTFAYYLAEKGYKLILVGRNQKKLKDLQIDISKQYNSHVQINQVDLLQMECLQQFVQELIESGIKLNLVINNAGIGHYGHFMQHEAEQDHDVVAINIEAVTYLTKQLYPCYGKGTKVLQVASTAAFAPGPSMAVYYASKAYVLSLGLALREEWRPDGIEVSVLCPGTTRTAFLTSAKMQKADFANKLALTPEQVVHVAYRGLIKNKAVIVPGWTNKVSVVAMGLLPATLGAKLVYCTQKK